ncbi:hypothetical protein [Capnocytophaga gingivalis]|jgi:hypothetical protein|uniref:Uncharacterized protein n=1 Tax=Capnocytophaga gingivalis TaxID=1017 RepID=A0A250FRF4_9FLAO|nr:hypothetical protein [Capnocytophaga gingivalis]ATA86547.1 hypothetical protein CGC50_04830 [Capnocytophaga gingivalis]
MRNLLLYISILSFVGCNLFQKQQPAGESVASFWKDEVFVPVEKELYVIKDVTTIYASLTDSIPSLFCIMGDKLEIIAEGKELYKTERGYVEKEDMGDWEALKSKMTGEVLVESIYGDISDTISKYLNINQVSSEEYQEALKNKVDFLQRDTLAIVKKKGKLTFVCKQRTVYLKDDISELADKHFDMIYTYLGNIPAIDQYVVLEDTERSLAYILIDKTTGEKRRFEKFPFLSADKRYIINIGRDYYDLDRLISLYRIEHIKPLKIDTLVEGYTKSWDVYDLDKEPIFFSKNDYLYAPMNVVGNFFDEHNNPNKQRMYIKIGIRNQ